jgi:hypothetical protein
MTRKFIGWGSLLAVLGLLVTLWAIPATASSPSPSPNQTKAERFCARIPKATAKVNKALSKLQADATTKGSIAWLNAQATKAQNDGKPALATMYRDRAKTRTDQVTVLKDRQTALTHASAWCKNA